MAVIDAPGAATNRCENFAQTTLAACAATTVRDPIARSHAVSLREAGPNWSSDHGSEARLDCELAAARATLLSVLADDLAREDTEQLAQRLQLGRIWRGRQVRRTRNSSSASSVNDTACR